MTDVDTNAVIRTAMLSAAGKWRDEADTAETMTGATVARVIADAFTREADQYRKPRPTLVPTDERPLVDEAVVPDVDEAIGFDTHDPENEHWKPMGFNIISDAPSEASTAQKFAWDEINKL
jgi:hypothetical protein